MTVQEFSDEFDVLYNNITSNLAPGLDEYEKSIFLTKALDEIVKAYFDPKLNKVQEGFDSTLRRQIDFSMLMRTTQAEAITGDGISVHPGDNIKYYKMPADILLYINEILTVYRSSSTSTRNLTVIPISYLEYSRLMSKPFKRPLKNLAWRLITSGTGSLYTYTDYGAIALELSKLNGVTASYDKIYNTIANKTLEIRDSFLDVDGSLLCVDGTLATSENYINISGISNITDLINKTVPATSTIVELIPGPSDTITNYIIRYVARPKPIVLGTFSDEEVSIDSVRTPQTCELDPILHHEILQRAVELAKAAYAGDLTSTLSLGVNSETSMGMVTSSKS